MGYLYNLYEGSLDELAAGLGPVGGWEQRVEALDRAVLDGTGWALVDPYIAELDWHELDELRTRARAAGPEVEELVSELFEAPPLGIEPFDFGFVGSLPARKAARLRVLLEPAAGGLAERVRADRRLVELPEYALGCLLRGLRPATPGKDLVLRLG